MAINTFKRGFSLLIAVIFVSVMLALGTALASLGYKQSLLANTAIQSQYAFYTADAALECALYADQQGRAFDYSLNNSSSRPAWSCDNTSATYTSSTYNANLFEITERLSLDSNTHCADVTIYKYSSASPSTYIFAQGYNASCATVAAGTSNVVERGLYAKY